MGNKKSSKKKKLLDSIEEKSLSDLLIDGGSQDTKSEIYKFLEDFMSDKNLEQKTDLKQPILWSVLDVAIDYYTRLKLSRVVKMLEKFKISSFKNLISKKRLGRKEIVECMKALGINIDTSNLKDIRKVEDIF